MQEYIAQTSDKRNISYIDDDPASVKRRAEYFGYKVERVLTADEYELERYGPTYQAEVVAIHEQLRLNSEVDNSIKELSA